MKFTPEIAASAALSSPLGFAGLPPAQYGVAALSICLVILCVLLHFEVLRKLSDGLDRLHQLHRTRVLVLILGLLVTHVLEIWIYAVGYGMLNDVRGFGRIIVAHDQTPIDGWLDYVYFSFITFATVGYGDLVPVGPIRFIAATEALNGFVLLGWSASFTFLEMQRFWREHHVQPGAVPEPPRSAKRRR